MPATDADSLLTGLAVAMSRVAPALSEELTKRMISETAELRGDERIEVALLASVSENVALALHVLALELDPSEVEAPAAAIEYARWLAQRGVPISALLRAYRLGHESFQRRMTEEIAKATSDPDLVSRATQRLTVVGFGYVDNVSEQVVLAYQQERERWLKSRLASRSARVLSLLAGENIDLAEAENTLGYRLRQPHVGVVVWTEDAEPRSDHLLRLERSVAQLAELVGCTRSPLCVPHDEATMWAWLPSPTFALTRELAEQVAAASEVDAWLAAGSPASEVDGFRTTHRQARQAQTLALAIGPSGRARLTSATEIGPLALMCSDLGILRTWVHDTLGHLAADDELPARLRETLRVFLGCGGSFSAAAEKLMLHKNTVQYRVRKAQAILGRPIQEDRLDIELALLACHWMGSAVLRASSTDR